MTFLGQTSTHFPQPVQTVESMEILSPTNFIAPVGQFLSQSLHLMHPFVQEAATAFPGWGEQHLTKTFEFLGTSASTPLGHVRTHIPHPVHFFQSMLGRPFTILMAPKGHAFSQSPNPKQENGQLVGPPWRMEAAKQLFSPVYL